MQSIIGLAVAVAVAGGARAVGLDRDRAFYPTVLFAIAGYYILFAAMAAPGSVLMIESLLASGFLLVGVAGFRTNLWLVAAALAGHGAFDLVHDRFIDNAGVPAWWPAFCAAVDLTLAVALGFLLARPGHVCALRSSLLC